MHHVTVSTKIPSHTCDPAYCTYNIVHVDAGEIAYIAVVRYGDGPHSTSRQTNNDHIALPIHVDLWDAHLPPPT